MWEEGQYRQVRLLDTRRAEYNSLQELIELTKTTAISFSWIRFMIPSCLACLPICLSVCLFSLSVSVCLILSLSLSRVSLPNQTPSGEVG